MLKESNRKFISPEALILCAIVTGTGMFFIYFNDQDAQHNILATKQNTFARSHAFILHELSVKCGKKEDGCLERESTQLVDEYFAARNGYTEQQREQIRSSILTKNGMGIQKALLVH